MPAYKLMQASFSDAYSNRSAEYRARVSKWKKTSTVERVERPSNPARAHTVGYKAKKEFIVARVRVAKGKRRLAKRALGRKPAKKVKFRSLGFSLARMSEMKAEKEFPNFNAVGSYFVGEDGMNKYFEVVLRNPHAGSSPKRG